MITKSIYASGSKGHHRFTLNIQEDSVSISDNSSLLSFKFIISATNSSWQWRSYNNITYSITIGTQTYTGTIPNFNGNTTTIRSVSGIEIIHESDGTKTIPVSFSVVDPNSVNYTCGNASESSTMELTQLHTRPQITFVNFAEDNILLTGMPLSQIARYLSIRTHTITAEAYDGATISKYRVYNGTELLLEKSVLDANPNVLTVDYSNVELQTNVKDNIPYAIIRLEVEDSKGGIGYLLYDHHFSILDYQKPNIITTSSNIKRNGQSTGEVNLNLDATFTAGTIGATTNDINTISLQFAYWKTSESESTTYFSIPTSAITISGNDLTVSNWTMQKNNVTIDDIDVDDAYYFKLKFTDAFNKVSEVTLFCNQGKYIMCKFKDRVDFTNITKKHEILPIIDSGFEDVATSVGANSYSDIPITFNYEFDVEPYVYLTLVSSSTAGGAYGSISIVVVNGSVTTTGFTARAYNSGSSARDVRFNWLAVENTRPSN